MIRNATKEARQLLRLNHLEKLTIHTIQPSKMSKPLIPTEGRYINARQYFFVLYFCLVMTDIVVLNLFAEFWHRVHVGSFTASIIAAILLQFLVKVTLRLEHMVAASFKGKTSIWQNILKKLSLWAVLFSSKFAILLALAIFVGEEVHFEGKLHGVLPLIVVIVVMIIAELAVGRLTDILGDEEDAENDKAKEAS